jgi:uncharacterized membrane protein
MNLYYLLFYFIIYAFLGWCTEVVYAAVNTGTFVNRGFLNGPVCPIYGFGIAAITALLAPVSNNLALLFAGSAVITSLIELITGWIMEKAFHTRWWDYSDIPFNIGGYICLKFSIAWGIACVMIMDIIHPVIQDIILKVDFKTGKIILSVALAAISVDCVATVQSVLKLNRQLRQINYIASKIRALSDDIGQVLYSESISLMEKGEEVKATFEDQKTSINELLDEKISDAENSIVKLKSNLNEKTSKLKSDRELYTEKLEDLMNNPFFGQKRLLKAFPNLKSTNYAHDLEELKKKIFKNK